MSAQSISTGPKSSSNITKFSAEVTTALKATQDLQDSVHKLLETFTTWRSQESESCLAGVRDTIKDIQTSQNKLEKTVATFTKLPETQPVALGNCGLISLHPNEDKSSIYRDLVQAYSWVSKLNADANQALKKLKRKYPEPEIFPFPTSKRPKDSSGLLQGICQTLQSQCPDLLINIPDQKVACLKIVIKGVLSAFILFSGGSLDRVIVRSDTEDRRKDECLDLWTPSAFLTFQKVTEVSQAALLSFYSPTEYQRSAWHLVQWLSSYKTLFSDKCDQCNRHLKVETAEGYLMPPCWRDFLTHKSYHTTCR
ncbi:mediator of RNA polymerase II transcription subunit 27-like [Rhopilema esculentum]|uniref:mediator of RNA polymerase II transcription subunit 27-like n=1 Tax=Rhopilema esculentum TaxID=499914 RepID=UPI0031D86B1E